MSCIPMICISRGQIPIHAGPGVISRYVSVLRQRNGTRASQYFALMRVCACWNSSGFRKRTRAENSASDLPAHVRGSNLHFRIVSQSLGFAGLAGGHDEEVSILFAEPDRCVHGRSIFAEGRQTDITLATDLRGNRGRHPRILNGPAFRLSTRTCTPVP